MLSNSGQAERPRHPDSLPPPARELALAAWDLVAAGAEVAFHARAPRAVLQGARFARQHAFTARNVIPGPDHPGLDAFWPGEECERCPVLIFVHGGGWAHYRKELYTAVAAHLIPLGWSVILPEYTAYPRAIYRQMTAEVATAVAWTLDHLTDLGADPKRVYLAGHSAGAHLGALVALEPRWLEIHGHTPSQLAGYVGLSGVYDLLAAREEWNEHRAASELLTRVFDGQKHLGEASPMTHVHPGAPPSLLIHGAEDPYIPATQARAFCEALCASHTPCQLRIYRDIGHSDLILAPLADRDQRLWLDLQTFANTHP